MAIDAGRSEADKGCPAIHVGEDAECSLAAYVCVRRAIFLNGRQRETELASEKIRLGVKWNG